MIIAESIDIEEYLQSKHIEYSPPGSKNVSQNSVGIHCPFCNDTSNHLGIKLDTKQWNCWICGKKGNIFSLIRELEECSYRDVEEHLKPFAHSDMSLLFKFTDGDLRTSQERFELPKEACNDLLKNHRKYLKSRGFNPDHIFNKYKLKCVGPISRRWKNTLIVPIHVHRRVVSFVASDITGGRLSKYKNCPMDESLIPINNTLYNMDNANDTVVVTEGVTDVWNVGDGSVALFRKYATRQQLRILSTFNRVFIMLDPDALEAETVNMLSPADKLAQDLSAFTETEIIELTDCDPGDMKKDDIKHLRREIFGH